MEWQKEMQHIRPTTIENTHRMGSAPDPLRVIVEAGFSCSVALGLMTIKTPKRIRHTAPIKQRPIPTFISMAFETLASSTFGGASIVP